MTRLFHAYVMVDWSAAQAPRQGKDSIWIGISKRDARFRQVFEAFNPPTRLEAETKLQEIIADLERRNEKALIGFDFNLGFPSGTSEALGLAAPSFSNLWNFLASNIVDKKDNTNNRFAVGAKMNRLMTNGPRPFWGCPSRDAQTWLSTTKPLEEEGANKPFLPAYRHTETTILSQKARILAKSAPKSVWQLVGAGSVGGQTLVGIPMVKRLFDKSAGRSGIWPFTTKWQALTPEDLDPLSTLFVEVYPSLFPVKPEAGEVSDRAQIRTLCEHFSRLDEDGNLGPLFAPSSPVDEAVKAIVEEEEGWILGV